jgi:hypothetical protein
MRIARELKRSKSIESIDNDETKLHGEQSLKRERAIVFVNWIINT